MLTRLLKKLMMIYTFNVLMFVTISNGQQDFQHTVQKCKGRRTSESLTRKLARILLLLDAMFDIFFMSSGSGGNFSTL